ncbi:MAG: hypothetical protein ACXWLR_05750 [Myxococcales bacterium]
MRFLLVVLWLLGAPAEKPAPAPEKGNKVPQKGAPVQRKKRRVPPPNPAPGQPRADKAKTAMA